MSNIFIKFKEFFINHFPLLFFRIKYIFAGDDNLTARKNILNYYKSRMDTIQDSELKEAIEYTRKYGVKWIPSPINKNYNPGDVEVYTDEKCGLKYVIHNSGHKLYFPRGFTNSYTCYAYAALIKEQDPDSPHCYLSNFLDVDANDVVFDVGGAEGLFSLMVVDRVSEICIFEFEEEWIEALQKTFEPWKNKVTIINKYVSDKDSDTTITLDTFVKDKNYNSIFLKMDVEGAEKQVIEGAQHILTSDEFNVKAAICTYHQKDDYEELSKIMSDLKYDVKTSKGYLLLTSSDTPPPYFRRGLIYCKKANTSL